MRTRLFLLMLFCAGILCVSAQNVKFQSSYLEKTAQKLKLSQMDSLTVGINTVEYKGMPLVVVMDADSSITHIGQRIFASICAMTIHHPFIII